MKQNNTTEFADHTETANAIVRDLFELGRSWTEYGLVLGRLAVKQSARTLEQGAKVLDGTAELLGGLSKELHEDKPA